MILLLKKYIINYENIQKQITDVLRNSAGKL